MGRNETDPKQLVVEFIQNNKENYYRLAYSYVKNVDDALDIVHESVYKAMTSSPRVKKPEDVKPWVYRIVGNTSLDFLRKHKPVVVATSEILEFYSSHTEDTYPDYDLYQALDSLTPKYRSVIILRYFEDLKIQDIAVILGENPNTVKTRLYSALRKLRIQLED